MEFRKIVMITLYAKQKKRHRCIEDLVLIGDGLCTIFQILIRMLDCMSMTHIDQRSSRIFSDEKGS